MKDKLKNIINNRSLVDYLILILITYILILPMYSKKIDIYVDDGVQHIARAYGTFESIKQGVFLGNIIESFSNNCGYSWNLFYGPLSTYGIIFIKLFCNSFITAYKILSFLCLILSGISMYKLVFEITKNKNTALVSSTIYVTFPYHLTDLYIRNALGEYTSFIFIPLIFLGLYKLFNSKQKNYYLTIGAVGIILTHNISAMITTLFALIYVCLNIKKLKNKNILKFLIINICFIVAITSFYWIPLIQTKKMADYHVYEDGAMSTDESVLNHGLLINQFFVTKKDGSFVFELGPHVIIMLVFSIMAINLMEKNKKEYLFFLFSGFLSLWMSSRYFPWKIMPKIILLIQFPWRMLTYTAFFFSIVCSINMSMVIKKYNFKDSLIILIICVLYTISLKDFIPYNDNILDINNYNLGFISGTETIQVIAGEGKGEYLPENAYNNRFYIATRENAIYVLDGKAIIEDENKNGSNFKAKIRTAEEDTIFEFPFIYYPGYKVTADGMNIETFETENGFLGIKLSSNENVQLEVNYKGTNLMRISLYISVISLLIFIIFVKQISNKENETI